MAVGRGADPARSPSAAPSGSTPTTRTASPGSPARAASARNSLLDHALEAQFAGAPDERDASMSVAKEHPDALARRRFVVEIDPVRAGAAFRPPERDMADVAFPEIREPRVVGNRPGQDQRVRDSAGHDPLEIRHRILIGPAQEDDQVEVVRPQTPPRSLEKAEHPAVGILAWSRRRQKRGDHSGRAFPKAPPGLVGNVARLESRLLDPRARLGFHVGLIVQRPGHGPDRQIQLTREPSDAHSGSFPRRPISAKTACIFVLSAQIATLPLGRRGVPPMSSSPRKLENDKVSVG